MATAQSSGKMTRNATTRSSNATLAATDSGVVQKVTTAGTVITLPSTAVGLSYTIMAGDNGIGFSVSPAAADQIIGYGFTATDNKDAVISNANATSGSFITLFGDGSLGWYVVDASTGFTREA